jgi:SH3-like domain-containing protein
MPTGRWAIAGAILAFWLAFPALAPAAGPSAQTESSTAPLGPSGLPLPRFVSIKAEKVNVRSGPTLKNDVNWVYVRVGLPVEIIAEYDNWRRIRDWEGGEGWVQHSLLSGRRTALVSAPAKAVDDFVPLHASADVKSAVTARVQAGVLAAVKRCSGAWCRITGEGFDGWIEQQRLWGVYPGEKVD